MLHVGNSIAKENNGIREVVGGEKRFKKSNFGRERETLY